MVGWNDKDDVMMRMNGTDASAGVCLFFLRENSYQENRLECWQETSGTS